ncbi:Rpn family recombination-promoting nuclease/putative transposase [Vagococcus sp. WN89Y]|uniref:Rpn family recombination-promoting nuclease/putative transposase n=1 Tax=Vagococcus sp. WN89Y TaxID=3457258 RepID=UPI003FCCF4F3
MTSKLTARVPHDAIFRQFLMQPNIARDFMEIHLPAELRAICDLSTLQLDSGSFVEEKLRPYYSDVLYKLNTTAGDGYIHVLIEHQSTPDKHMGFRLMRYALAAMQRHIDKGGKTLPLVIPVLFYAGKRSPYPYSTNWLKEFADPDLAARLYTGELPLVDITIIPDDEIMEHRSMAALTLLQKHIRQRDLAEQLDSLTSVLLAGYLSSSQVISLVHYIIKAGETSDAKAFVHELARRVPEYEEELMTIAKQLEKLGVDKGIQLGVEIGIKEGLKEGEKQGKMEVARAMLENGIDTHTVMKMTNLSESDLSQLQH